MITSNSDSKYVAVVGKLARGQLGNVEGSGGGGSGAQCGMSFQANCSSVASIMCFG
jgi:hypothetical protein